LFSSHRQQHVSAVAGGRIHSYGFACVIAAACCNSAAAVVHTTVMVPAGLKFADAARQLKQDYGQEGPDKLKPGGSK
jgi:hypothetical protein